MDIFVFIFIGATFAALIVGYLLEGGALGALVQVTAFIIVVGGTIGATGLSFTFTRVSRIGGILKALVAGNKFDAVATVKFFYDVSQTTRKNGLLSIEEELNNKTDINPLAKKGLLMIVDGYDAELIRGTLEIEADSISQRHKDNAGMFDQAGGYSPTYGIIGTVMGLVNVLGNMEDPSTLGPMIAVAFIATLYGAGFANILYLPIGTRLKDMNKEELLINTMIIEGVLEVQAGTHPVAIVKKLSGMLDKKQASKLEEIK